MNYNEKYFQTLLKQFRENKSSELKIYHPEDEKNSNVYPFALLKKEDLKDIHIEDYKNLKTDTSILKNVDLCLLKMHAGLGSSVKRIEHLKKCSGRDKLGSKGTDLYLKIDDNYLSLAELQLKQVELLNKKSIYNSVSIQNMINFETVDEVQKLNSKYKDYIDIKENINQEKMKTIGEDGELTSKRLAPAGHAFLGFHILMDIFLSDTNNTEILSIGNGEDLNSSADEKIVSWVCSNEIPIVMITTTKLEKDKKGGQISLVKEDQSSFVTIVEKAQAEKANQLSYFEEIGLRENDEESLFNTNIVLINKKSLKTKFNKFIKYIEADEFMNIISPDLIKNIKSQDGENFIQLEGAIGSTLLNLDKYFRLNFKTPLISFLNLDSRERENFFIPIKKMEDFEDLIDRYTYNNKTGRLDLK